MTDRIFALFKRPSKPDEMSAAQRRIYEYGVRQIHGRREKWGPFPQAEAPFYRAECDRFGARRQNRRGLITTVLRALGGRAS
jgi:hypothetical protein